MLSRPCLISFLVLPCSCLFPEGGRIAGLMRFGPNAILSKTCSVLLCVFEQPRVDSSVGSLKRGAQLGAICPIGVRAVPNEGKCFIKESNNISHIYSSDISQRKIQL